MKNQYIKIIVVAVIVAAIAYGLGVKHGQSSSLANQNRGAQFANFAAGRTIGARGANGGITAGEVISKDSSSITLKLRSGGSINVFYATSTQVQKTASGLVSDIDVGTQVTVSGSSNSDGSITAQNIQIRPEGLGTSTLNVGR